VRDDARNHELALARALEHLQEIERQAVNWREGEYYRLIHEFDAGPRDYVISVEDISMPNWSFFPVAIGDCLHNLSSSLNFLAFDLAIAHSGSLSETAANECDFPIFGDVDRHGNAGTGERRFRKGSDRRIGSAAPRAQAVIEDLQPYQRDAAFIDDPLWKLYELSRLNRHRFLHPAIAAFEGAVFDYFNSSNARMGPQIHVYAGLIEGRTEVVRFGIEPVDPRQKVHVDFKPNLQIVFPKGTPIVSGQSIPEVLSEIYNHIVAVIVPRLSVYL
jgi:hypothetical protein